MSESRSTITSGGISFVGLLQVAFIVLKLCKVIDWSWWLVLSPILVSMALAIVTYLIILIIIFIRAYREVS